MTRAMRIADCVVCARAFVTRADRSSKSCSSACRVAALRAERLRRCRVAENAQPRPPVGARWLAVSGRNGFNFVLVDADVFQQVSAVVWGNHKGYARSSDRIFLHHLVTGVPSDGVEVDHINRDRTDNRRENLRFVTRAQNNLNRGLSKANTSGFKGVHRSGSSWRAEIGNTKLGSFLSIEDAARAYDAAARKLHGEFAVLNFADVPFVAVARSPGFAKPLPK